MANTVELPRHLAEFDAWLSQRESIYPDLVPGTEKTIVWQDDAARQTDCAVVFIHGFSASRQELAPLPQQVAAACQANLFCTRLTAHGRGPDAFGSLEPTDWFGDAIEALEIGRRLGRRVILMGSSTGATLTLDLAQRDPHIDAVVLLSPNLGVATDSIWQLLQQRLLVTPWGKALARQLIGTYFTQFTPISEAHGRFWTPRYRSEGLVTLFSFLAACQKIAFERITTPCLMAYSPHDTVIDLRALRKAYERIASVDKQLLCFESAKGHVLAGDILSPQTTSALSKAVVSFLDDKILHAGNGRN